MKVRKTNFNLEKINDMLRFYSTNNYPIKLPKRLCSYKDFSENIPIMNGESLMKLSSQLLENKVFKNCNFVLSSGSRGVQKLLAHKLLRTKGKDTYPHQLASILKQHVFSPNDIVANLFTAGGLSDLHEGCNRFLGSIGLNILSIGRLDLYGDDGKQFIDIMSLVRVNTLLGTPSSLIQCANLLEKYKMKLDIDKIVFTGENLNQQKKNFLSKFFPEVSFYGLYGATEFAFIGVHTSNCLENCYHLLDEWFFVETTEKGELLITDLTTPIVPLLRYFVGDIGSIVDKKCQCGLESELICLHGRCDKKFNFMGNLISFEEISSGIKKLYKNVIDVQLQISTRFDGKDVLSIVVDDKGGSFASIRNQIFDTMLEITGIKEGIEKKAGIIDVLPRNNFIYSARNKLLSIVDRR